MDRAFLSPRFCQMQLLLTITMKWWADISYTPFPVNLRFSLMKNDRQGKCGQGFFLSRLYLLFLFFQAYTTSDTPLRTSTILHMIAAEVLIEEPRRLSHSYSISILKRYLFWQNPSCALNNSIIVVAESLPLSSSICPRWASAPVLFDRHCVYLDFRLVICLLGSHLWWVPEKKKHESVDTAPSFLLLM